MGADRAVDIVMGLGDGGDGLEIAQTAADRDHALHAGRTGPLDDGVEIVGKLFAVKIDVCVDEHDGSQATSLRAASRAIERAASALCFGSR